MLGALIAWVMGSACVADAGAQTVRRIGDQIWLRVPTEVVVYAAEKSHAFGDGPEQIPLLGRAEIVLKDIGPFPRNVDPLVVAPREVPIRTVFADGTSAEGRWLENPTEHTVSEFIYDAVPSVMWNVTTGYRAGAGFGTLSAHEFSLNGPLWRAGERYTSGALLHRVGVYYRDAFAPRQNFDIIYQVLVDAAHPLPPGVQRPQLDAALERVRRRFVAAMSPGQNSGPVSIEVVFDSLPSGTLAGTSHNTSVDALYDTVAAAYTLRASLDNENDDIAFSDALPPGTTVPCRWNSGLTTDAARWLVRGPIWRQLYQATDPGPDARVTLNSQRLWDTDMSDGLLGVAVDVEGRMMHETFHALGFSSIVDLLEFQQPRTTFAWMDLFRFSFRPVSDQDFLFFPRSLVGNDPLLEAWTPTLLDVAAATYPMSRGNLADGAQAHHWRDPALDALVRIGLMVPGSDLGEFPHFRGYASNADWGALDILGWNINRPVVSQEPEMCILDVPVNGAQLTSRAPTLAWQPNSSANSFAAFVHQGTTITTSSLRFTQAGITSNSVSVPWGTLQGGVTYTWFVTAHNNDGFTLSAKQTFTTQCVADYDDGSGTGAPDGGVTIDDLLYYAGIFDIGDVGADVDNGSGLGVPDGGVTIDDLLYFLGAFTAGC